MSARDHRLGQAITLPHLQYVTCIAFCNRIVQCATTFGYAFPANASRLNQVASSIRLPSVLAHYIESIGSFTMSSGVSVVPYVTDYSQLFPIGTDLMVDPAGLVGYERRDNDEIHRNEWPLDIDIIVAYNNATTRASHTGMLFRNIDNDDLQGRAEMIVSYVRIGVTLLLPRTPQIITESEAQLGAAYLFRDYTNLPRWFGTNKELLFDACTSVPFEPGVLFSNICVAAHSRDKRDAEK